MRYFQILLINCILFCNLFLTFSCNSFLLPPLEVNSYSFDTKSINIIFSQNPTKESIYQSFSIVADEEHISGKFEFLEKQVRYVFSKELDPLKIYKLTLLNSLETEKGISLLEDYIIEFSFKDDFIPPKINKTFPENNEICFLNQDFYIEINFSETILLSSFEESLNISPNFDYICFIDKQNSNCVKIIPKFSLERNQRYVVSLTDDIKDICGNKILESYSFSFDYYPDTIKPSASIQKLDKKVKISWSEPINISEISKFIEIEPDIEVDIEANYDTNDSILLDFNNPEWGKIYNLKIKKGISDLNQNKSLEDKIYKICFDDEKDRPVSFINGFFKNGLEYFEISPLKQYQQLILDPLTFPSGSLNEEVNTFLYLFFRISKVASGIDIFSVMDSINFSSSNNCVSFDLKNIKNLSFEEILLDEISGNVNSDIFFEQKETEKGVLVGVKIKVAVKNSSNQGILYMRIDKTLNDSLGNSLLEDIEYEVNKI